MKGNIMENRKNKFKAYIKSHSTVIVLTSAAVLTVGIRIALSATPKSTQGTPDGVSDELWDEMMAVAKKMDDAVAEHKANKKDS
jgi:hypothetical protein